MNAAEDYASGTNQRDLAAGVLKQAAQDLRRFNGATTNVEHELYLDAYSWITSEDCEWPFSFLNVCQLLHLSPDIVRRELLADASVGFFTYWTRRCERGARSIQSLLSNAFTRNGRPTAVDPVPLTQFQSHEVA
jgi:hypothetical protein